MEIRTIVRQYMSSLLYKCKKQIIRIYYIDNNQLKYQNVLIDNNFNYISISDSVDSFNKIVYALNESTCIIPVIIASLNAKTWLCQSRDIELYSGKEILVFYFADSQRVYQLNEFISMKLNIPNILMDKIKSDCFLHLINIDDEPIDYI